MGAKQTAHTAAAAAEEDEEVVALVLGLGLVDKEGKEEKEEEKAAAAAGGTALTVKVVATGGGAEKAKEEEGRYWRVASSSARADSSDARIRRRLISRLRASACLHFRRRRKETKGTTIRTKRKPGSPKSPFPGIYPAWKHSGCRKPQA